MKTLVTLNKTHFIITVVKGTSVAAFQPGYICEANGITSSVYDTPSGAINFLYHILFSSKTRFSGPLICGFNDKEINKRILDDIPFQPFTIMVGNLQIFIGMIGVSDQENLGYVGPGYLSSFIYRVGEEKIRTLFVQQIHQRHCSVALYQDERIKLKYSGKNPVEVWKEVWKKIEVLQNWDGKTLFDKSDKEFWTKAENPIDDKHVLIYLTNLLVAPTTIFDARKYARLNGPGAKQIEKPIRTFDGNSE
ncbi:unnamed protein product [Rhizophagus irregularis]|nr:unnamed protein product [Rhizophagus irregularis]